MFANPCTPGEGAIPTLLAGREPYLERATIYLQGIKKQYPQQPVIYYGLRGAGKTVLLNAVEEIADTAGILHDHINASEDGLFVASLINALNKFAVSISKNVKDQKCIPNLESYSLRYNPEDKSFENGTQPKVSLMTGIFEEDLKDVLVTLGKAAAKSGDAICLFIDEIQCLSLHEIGGLAAALHRCNQLRLPVMLFGAGLPNILELVGEAKSYTERLFKFEVLSNPELAI